MDPKKLMPSEQILPFASYVFFLLLLLLLVKIYNIPEITRNNSDYPFFFESARLLKSYKSLDNTFCSHFHLPTVSYNSNLLKIGLAVEILCYLC